MSHPAIDVSVVVPSFGMARYLGACLRSALADLGPRDEIVVCDDASTDGSWEVARSIGDPRVHLVRHAVNRGVAAAVNTAVAASRGRYLARLNADDLCLPGRLARQCATLDKSPRLGAVFGLPRFLGDGGAWFPADPPFPYRDLFVVENHDRHGWVRRFFQRGNCLCSPAAMVRREAWDAIGGLREGFRYLSDFDAWVRMVTQYDIMVMPREVTGFRVHAAALSHPSVSRDAEVVLEELAILSLFRSGALLDAWGTPDPLDQIFLLAESALANGSRAHRVFTSQLLLESSPPAGDEARQNRYHALLHAAIRGSDLFAIAALHKSEKARLKWKRRAGGHTDLGP